MFVDAYLNREQDIIQIVERDKSDKRIYKTYPADYSFYYEDPRGQFKSIYGDNLSKVAIHTFKSFQKEQKLLQSRKLFENDVKPIFKVLEQNYLNCDLPNLHLASLDIETGFSQEKGYATPDDPHQPITAISVNLDWKDQMITLVLKPMKMLLADAEEIASRFENCFIFEDERELLKVFYDIIEDVDVLYTWNGEGFDIPYIVNRTSKILGKEYTRKLCLWDLFPKKRM